jgi:hypothetical protein
MSLPTFAPIARSNFKVGGEQQINDVERIIGLINNERSSTRRLSQEFGMLDNDLTAISQMNGEWPKRSGFVKASNLIDCHSWL